MDLRLAGKTVLITGASKGIGLACAELFAEEGCDLHLVARTEGDLERARDTIRGRHNVAVTIHPLDLSDGGNVKRLVAETGEGLDIVVNNA
ncbi:MAG: SDR family NAD(P)-dependent oxidoreductase, partial [Alphaproteobacteria bacterium]|nr:SDR family NAD(P)-dependent oxidoreductase [Alphaproteobacteria bacterium]